MGNVRRVARSVELHFLSPPPTAESEENGMSCAESAQEVRRSTTSGSCTPTGLSMRSDEGVRPSIWDLTDPVTPLALLPTGEIVVDVCVIGAGIAGLTTAYELARAGRRVLVLDDGPLGGGETARTTAHLATSFDDEYHEVEKMHGAEVARLLAASFKAGVDAIERIVSEEQIECGFVRLDGWWVPSTDDTEARFVAECDAARRAGFADVELVNDHPLSRVFPGSALRFPRQAQFHVLRYMSGLAEAFRKRGGRIASAHVERVDDAPDEAGRCTVHLDDGRTLQASQVVVATNSPIVDRVAMHTKQAPYRSYVIAARVASGAVPAGLFWDTEDPYHYVRLLDGPLAAPGHSDVLIVGGEDHKTGQSDDENAAFDRLEAWTRSRFAIESIEARWSGQVLEPVDYIAYIGRNPGSRKLWIVTGDSGNGMTHGTIAGLLLPTLMEGKAHAWEAMFSPSRITVSLDSVVDYVKENLNVAAQFADLVTGGEAGDASEIPAGEGRIVRRGVHKLAVFRPFEGAVVVRSAVCPHLGCIVDWNAAEKSWDCPCHGSRFATDGAVLNGPSTMPLSAATLGE